MVQAIIDINENANRTINIIKAKFGLKDKSQAINMMAKQYSEILLEPQLRPEYIEKLKKISAGKHIEVKDIAGLRKEIGLKSKK